MKRRSQSAATASSTKRTRTFQPRRESEKQCNPPPSVPIEAKTSTCTVPPDLSTGTTRTYVSSDNTAALPPTAVAARPSSVSASASSTSNSQKKSDDYVPPVWKSDPSEFPDRAKNFPLLSILEVPLGDSEEHQTSRIQLLHALLKFNEEFNYLPHKCNWSPPQIVMKIPRVVPLNKRKNAYNWENDNDFGNNFYNNDNDEESKDQSQDSNNTTTNNKKAIKIELHREFAYHMSRIGGCNGPKGWINTLLKNVNRRDQNKLEAERIEECALWFICYFAKYHNNSFMEVLDFAQDRQTYNLARQSKKPIFRPPPPSFIMYDGGDRMDPNHVRWNENYLKLKEYQQIHNTCLFNFRQDDPKLQQLARFVAYQRTAKKSNIRALTPQGIALLNGLGFVWEVKTDCFDPKNCPPFLKAIAVKRFFSPPKYSLLTAKDAMLVAGMNEEDAVNETKKKTVNEVIRVFDMEKKKHINKHMKPQILEYSRMLEAADAVGSRSSMEEVFKELFGNLDISDEDDKDTMERKQRQAVLCNRILDEYGSILDEYGSNIVI